MDDGGIRRRRISVSDCFREGWGLLRGRYWLFLGIVVIGHLLGSMAPMGILMGPMLAGIFLCFLRAERGGPVAFGDLFKGFDLFVEGLVAWLVFLGFSTLAAVPFMAVFIAGFLAFFVRAARGDGGAANVASVVVLFGAAYILTIIASLIVRARLLFAFALIAERRLKGWEAIRASYSGTRGHTGALVLLLVVEALLMMAGALACYVGMLFLWPVVVAADFAAYRRLFDVCAPPPPPPAGSFERRDGTCGTADMV